MALQDATATFPLTKEDITPVLIYMLERNPNVLTKFGKSKRAFNRKHQWYEYQQSPVESNIKTADIAATDTTVVVDDDAVFAVHDIINFDDGYDDPMKITAINTGTNTLTIDSYPTSGSGVTYAHIIGVPVMLVSRPQIQSSTATEGTIAVGVPKYNVLQIFRRSYGVSATAEVEGKHTKWSTGNIMDRGTIQMTQEMAYEMARSAVLGRRTSETETRRTMGGLLEFIDATGGNIYDASTATLTETMINDIIEDVISDGGKPNLLLAHPIQTRLISAFNRATANRYETIAQGAKAVGGWIDRFQSDMINSNIVEVQYDYCMPKDVVFVLDTSQLEFVPMENRGLTRTNSTLPGTDGIQYTLIAEVTIAVSNALTAHGIVKNLAV